MDRLLSRKTACVALFHLTCLFLGASQAHAGFTIALDSAAPNGGGATAYNYAATIASGDSIVAGDYFRIYDFNGLVKDSVVAPAGWTVTVNNYDPIVPPNFILIHGDDAAVANLTFTYVGTAAITGMTEVTGFSALSAYGPALAVADFFGSNHNASLPGGVVRSLGDVSVPKPGRIDPQPAPEPTAVVSTALGVAVVGLFLRRRTLGRNDAQV